MREIVAGVCVALASFLCNWLKFDRTMAEIESGQSPLNGMHERIPDETDEHRFPPPSASDDDPS